MRIKLFSMISFLILLPFMMEASNPNEELKKNLGKYIENPNVAPFEGIKITYHKPWDIRYDINALFNLINLKRDLGTTSEETILMNIQNYINENSNFAGKIKLQLVKLGIELNSNTEIYYDSNEKKEIDHIYYSRIKAGKEKNIIEKEDILFKNLYEENSDTYTKDFLLNLSCHAVLEGMSLQLACFATKTLGKRTIKINPFCQTNLEFVEEVKMFKTSEEELRYILINNFPSNFDKLDKENLDIYVGYVKKIGEKYRKEFLYKNLEKIGLFTNYKIFLEWFKEIEKADEEHGYLQVSYKKVEDSLEGLQKEFEYHTILARLYYVLTRIQLTTDDRNEEKFKFMWQKNKEFTLRDDILTKTAHSFREQLDETNKKLNILTKEMDSLKFTLGMIKEENKNLKKEINENKQKSKKKNRNQTNINENDGLSNQLLNELNSLRQNSIQWNHEKLKLGKEIDLLKEDIQSQKKQTTLETQKIKKELFEEKKNTKNLQEKINSLKEELNKNKEKKITIFQRSEKDKKLFNELNQQINMLKEDLEEQKNKKSLDEKEIENLKILQKQIEEEKLEEKKQTEILLLEKDKEIDLLKQKLSTLALEKALKISNLNDSVSHLEQINVELRIENQELQQNLNFYENWNPYENSDPMYSQPQPYYLPQQQLNYDGYNQEPYNVQNQQEQIQQNHENYGENNNKNSQRNKKKKQFNMKKRNNNHNQNK